MINKNTYGMQRMSIINVVSLCFKEKKLEQSFAKQKESKVYTNKYTTHSYIFSFPILIRRLKNDIIINLNYPQTHVCCS